MKIVAETAHRAESQSPRSLNEHIHRDTQHRISCLAGHPTPYEND